MSFFTNVILFLVCLSVGMVIIQGLNPLGAVYADDPRFNMTNQTSNINMPFNPVLVQTHTWSLKIGSLDPLAAIGFALELVQIIGVSMGAAPLYLTWIGIPNAIANYLLIPYWIALLWFILQFAANRPGTTLE